MAWSVPLVESIFMTFEVSKKGEADKSEGGREGGREREKRGREKGKK